MRKQATSLAAVLAVSLYGCSDGSLRESPAGPGVLTPAAASTFTDNLKMPIDILVFVPCANGGAGELVELSGNLHVLTHTTINNSRFVSTSHFQPQGIRGFGSSTADKYQATGVTRETFRGSFVNGQFHDTFLNNFRIIGQGGGNNFLVHENFHVTINANGELTAFVDSFRVECK